MGDSKQDEKAKETRSEPAAPRETKPREDKQQADIDDDPFICRGMD